MSYRNLTVTRTVSIAVALAAVMITALTVVVAQVNIEDLPKASNGLAPVDEYGYGTEPSDADGRITKQRFYPRSNYVWPYSAGPEYGEVEGTIRQQPGVLRTVVGSFDFRGGGLAGESISQELKTTVKLDRLGAQYFYVLYEGGDDTLDSLKRNVESNGGALISYSGGTAAFRLTGPSYDITSATTGVIAVVPNHPAYKLHPTIGRTPLADPTRATSEIYKLELLLWKGEDVGRVASALVEMGGNVLWTSPDSIVVDIHRSHLREVAALEPVQLVTEYLTPQMHGQETTTTMQHWEGDYTGAIPYHDAGVDGGGGGAGSGYCVGGLDAGDPCDDNGDCSSNDCDTETRQVLMIIDSGISLDAGDLSHTRIDSGYDTNETENVISGHRKVLAYQSTSQFGGGGSGDESGCDAPASGGFTHGHVVAAAAMGNGTAVDTGTYGLGWNVFDQQGNPWNVDGVADQGLLVAYDAQITPGVGNCSDPLLSGLSPGNLWTGGGTGSLEVSYTTWGARTVNFSWGTNNNAYLANAADIDDFLHDVRDSMVFVSAGNNGTDSDMNDIPDLKTLGSPATTKNGLAIGASRNANTVNSPESREAFSSTGPAVDDTVYRMAPQLMAPGGEPGGGSLGVSSEYSCRSNDNNQGGLVICDTVAGVEGTSFASPAAAGAAMVARDYFSQGFYPDGVANVSDQVQTVSGALVKALLAASADFMTGANVTVPHRWNFEQGYGRIQLDNVLPLQTWPDSPSGLLVHDPCLGVTGCGVSNMNLANAIDDGANVTTTDTFQVCDDEQELRIALAWTDPKDVGSAGFLTNNLELELVSPTGQEYIGNYFTDDNNQDGVNQAGEDCGGIGFNHISDINGEIDEGEWSQPKCLRSRVQGDGNGLLVRNDSTNPIEAIFLSPNPDYNFNDPPANTDPKLDDGICIVPSTANLGGSCKNDLDCSADPDDFANNDGTCSGGTVQTEFGEWTITVRRNTGGDITGVNQDFAVVIAGGVCIGSSVRFDKAVYACNEDVVVEVNELEAGAPSVATVEAETVVEIIRGGSPVDQEDDASLIPLNFSQPNPAQEKYVSDPIGSTDGTAPDPGNGVLDVDDGDVLRVTYNDLSSGDVRQNFASVNCRVDISVGAITFGQFGQDTSTLVQGGCERNLRNLFEFGYPDRYMDPDELIQYNFAFGSNETNDLEAVVAALRCVDVDDDSPAECQANGAGCVDGASGNCGGGDCDPRRENNPVCPYINVLDSPKIIGLVPEGVAIAANFNLQVEPDSTFIANELLPTIEMVLDITAATSGKTSAGTAVSRHKLNRDESSTLYNTDFPGGGTAVVVVDWNENEIAENPIFEPGTGFQGGDYRFETKDYGSILSGLDADGNVVPRNQNLGSPWNFDANNGGFVSGLGGVTDEESVELATSIANWGEDKNFNDIEDGECEFDRGQPCYDFGGDPRCPAINDSCESRENKGPGTGFVQNWNTKGGCGWQTRADAACSGAEGRGCFDNADCLGQCIVANNPLASGLQSCGTGQPSCPAAGQCSDLADNPREPCTVGDNGPCGDGGANDICVNVTQTCDGDDGVCTGVSTTGGVWHTGVINDVSAPECEGGSTHACVFHGIIPGSLSVLQWWDLLVTPEMEKINQSLDDDDLPNATIEITNWAWNQAINLADGNAAWVWELDTDTTALEPLDLFTDGSILNGGFGGFGAVSAENNPQLARGYSMFAPMSRCDVFQCGGAGSSCEVITDCAPGLCGAPAPPIACFNDATCEAAASGALCNSPAPEGCLGTSTGTFNTCNLSEECPAGTCSLPPFDSCHFDAECTAGTCVGAQLCDPQSVTQNGSDGLNDRRGDAGCFFEGVGKIPPTAISVLGLAKPRDDDQNNSANFTVCFGDNGVICEVDQDCVDKRTTGPCITSPDTQIDEYVTDNGPKRNFDLQDQPFNGPDMRFQTLEDFYGDTGNTFQAAVGFVNFEGTAQVPAKQDFGLAVDDMFVEWREFTLEQDTSDCDDGQCATIELSTTNVFDGNTVLSVSVLEPSAGAFACGLGDGGVVCFPKTEDVSEDRCPTTACTAATNDCDLDGNFREDGVADSDGDGDDVSDDNDCDDDGDPDLVVKVTTEAEPEGELVIVNQTSNSVEYTGQITISSLGDTDPGILFVAEAGADNPTVIVTYLDYNDGTTPAQICQNDVDPDKQGFVQSATTVFIDSTCNVVVIGTEFSDNNVTPGDLDGFPDTNETIDMSLVLINNCGFALNNCIARLSTSSENVACVIDPFISIPLLEDTSDPVTTADQFQWKVADVETTDGDNPLRADFTVTMVCDEIDALTIPGEISMALDLNINDLGQAPGTPFLETFEGGVGGNLGGTIFSAFNDDAGIPGANNAEGLINGDGYRCQHSDPDWANSGPYGDEKSLDCFPGDTLAQSEAVFWQIDGPGAAIGSPDGGRAFGGSHSLYYGVFLTDPAGNFSTPMGSIESAVSTPINLGITDDTGFVELSYWQQISLADNRSVNTLSPTRSADQGVVQLQIADRDTGTPVGDWIQLTPFQNAYEQQANDNYFNCMFDPIDDGSTEDDFFDPTDPNRRLGPSSSCFPEPSFACQGDTDADFVQSNICLAQTEPDANSHANVFGTGTWVEVKADLTEFFGRRVRLRYTATALKADFETWQAQFMHNPLPDEDGWWIDNVRINRTLTTPALFEPDTGPDNPPGCAAFACNMVTVNVDATPGGLNPTRANLSAPGQVIELDASSSFANSCPTGTLQYRFLKDSVELRSWSDNSVILDAPTQGAIYDVQVRCSSDIDCSGNRVVEVNVDCPSTGNLANPIFPIIQADDTALGSTDVTFTWGGGELADVWAGDLGLLGTGLGGSNYPGSVIGLGVSSPFNDPTVPSGGGVVGIYYIFREPGAFCNENGPWTSGGSGECTTGSESCRDEELP